LTFSKFATAVLNNVSSTFLSKEAGSTFSTS